jgi:hypothetical protein
MSNCFRDFKNGPSEVVDFQVTGTLMEMPRIIESQESIICNAESKEDKYADFSLLNRLCGKLVRIAWLAMSCDLSIFNGSLLLAGG